jgi:TonB family protein
MPYLPHLGEHPLVARVARFAGLREQELDTSRIYWVALGMLGVISLAVSVKPVALPPRSPLVNQTVNIVAIPTILPISFPISAVQVSHQSLYPVVQTSVWLPNNVDRLILQRINKPAYEPLPVYPGMALRHGVVGDVLVEYSVSADGAVSQAKIIRSKPPGVFEAATLRAVLRTEYVPTHRFDLGQTTRYYATDPTGGALRVQKEFLFRINAE